MTIRTVIVEDEFHVAEHLQQMIERSGRPIEIVSRLDTVDELVEWLKNNPADLIFLDIQLHNEVCFEIFDHVHITAPVIFTTSYNQYAIKSFEVNNLAYLLKPIEEDKLYKALDKYDDLYHQPERINQKVADIQEGYQKRFLVQNNHLMHAVPAEQIAYLYTKNRLLILVTKDKQQYVFDSTLKILEQRLDPEQFFRINPQFIVNFDAITKIQREGRAKIKIETSPACKEEMIISEERAPAFRSWLNK